VPAGSPVVSDGEAVGYRDDGHNRMDLTNAHFPEQVPGSARKW